MNLTLCLLPLGHLNVSFSGSVMAESVIVQAPRITSWRQARGKWRAKGRKWFWETGLGTLYLCFLLITVLIYLRHRWQFHIDLGGSDNRVFAENAGPTCHHMWRWRATFPSSPQALHTAHLSFSTTPVAQTSLCPQGALSLGHNACTAA